LSLFGVFIQLADVLFFPQDARETKKGGFGANSCNHSAKRLDNKAAASQKTGYYP
jgi:hypothetical protein